MPSDFSRSAAPMRKPRQQTLEAVLSRARLSKPRAPGSSPWTPQDVDDETGKEKSNNSDKDEEEEEEDDDDDLPIRRRPVQSRRTFFHTGLASQDIRSALSPAVAVATGSSQRRSQTVVLDSEDEGGNNDSDNDHDDDDDVRPTKRRRTNRTTVESSDDDQGSSGDGDGDGDDLVVLTPQTKPPARTTATTETKTPKTRLVRGPGEHSAPSRSVRKRVPPSARSARQRHMELLRRRRMGEKVTTSDLEGSSSEEDGDGAAGGTPRIALYDKDPDHVALSDFEDEEEEEEEGEGEGSEEKEEGEEGEGEGMKGAENDDGGSDVAEVPTPQRSDKAEKRREKEEKRRRRERKKAKREEEEEKRKRQEEDAVQFSKIMLLSRRLDDDDESVVAQKDDGYGYNDEETGRPEDRGSGDDDMADFIDDSHVVGLIGAPNGEDQGTEAKRRQAIEDEMAMLRREMPLQFTFQAHKPLKSHFKDAVEWLVHRRVNRPTTEDGGGHSRRVTPFASYCNDEVYRVAWDRLDREIGGLAQSRFISSTWTPEFHSALRARPYMDSFNLRPGRGAGGGSGTIYFPGAEENMCHACGRTNHPASYRVEFSGKAYNSNTLDDVDQEEEDDDDDDDDEDDNESVDMHGNGLPPTTRQWYVGTVCHSNAETAHGLLHWRRALMDWVEEKLAADRVLKRLEGSSKKHKKPMKARKRRDYANQIVDGWESNGTINSLFRDFMKLLEEARAKSTMTASRYGR